MAKDPTAQASVRVPRSLEDNRFNPAERSPETRMGSGVVVSLDGGNICTVLLYDENVPGVLWLGLVAPEVGDIVEVEVRGDLLVIPASNDLATGVDVTEQPVHLVFARNDPTGTDGDGQWEPPKPPPTTIQVGGSMRTEDGWWFYGADLNDWDFELAASGQGMHVFQLDTPPNPTGTLWSDVTFAVEPGDVIVFEGHLTELANSPTAELVVLYGAAEGGEPLPDDADAIIISPAPAVEIIGNDTEINLTVTVTDEMAFPIGDDQPRTARVGVRLVGDGGSEVVITSVSVKRKFRGWPVGSVWGDPSHSEGAATTLAPTFPPATPLTGTLAATTTDTPIPGAKKVVITPPSGTAGASVAHFSGAVIIKTAASGLVLKLVASAQYMTPRVIAYTKIQAGANAGTFPFSLRGVVEGLMYTQPVDIVPVYSYDGASVTTPHQITHMVTSGEFIAARARTSLDFYENPALRFWDGDRWQPKWHEDAYIRVNDASTAPPVTREASTTTIKRSAATLHEGSTIILTATVTGADGGSLDGWEARVTFYRKEVSDTHWVTIGYAVVGEDNRAKKTWITEPGTWVFSAQFEGTYEMTDSRSASSAETPITHLTTKTVTMPVAWAQAYAEDGTQIPGTRVAQGFTDTDALGNRSSLLAFDHSAIPAEAIVTAVQLVVKGGGWEAWHDLSGGTLVAGAFFDNDATPATWPTGEDMIVDDLSRHDEETGGFSANLSAWATAAMEHANFSGIVLGPGPSDAQTYFGYSATPAEDQFALKVSYQIWA